MQNLAPAVDEIKFKMILKKDIQIRSEQIITEGQTNE